MTRRDRQRAELLRLCRSGPPSRAVDLAFAHLADFGPDEELLDLLADALARAPAPAADRRRLAELRGGGPRDDRGST
ncbi:MAG TPA: hypothetical protein VKB57_13655 [Acidimicrobiales bacterium]|nr:hypothetical protein [Acidimicrobiales bacterium]